jgi:hypothetical protein
VSNYLLRSVILVCYIGKEKAAQLKAARLECLSSCDFQTGQTKERVGQRFSFQPINHQAGRDDDLRRVSIAPIL